MTKAALNQIMIATAATVIAGIALDYIRRPKQTTTPPPAGDNRSWYSGIFDNKVKLF